LQQNIFNVFYGLRGGGRGKPHLNYNGLPTYSTPEDAVKTYLYMYQHKRNLELLYETPEELPVDVSPPKRPINGDATANSAGKGWSLKHPQNSHVFLLR